MDELWELRQYLTQGNVTAALALLDEMEEMSKEDKIQKIASSMRVLLVHLIKQAVEHRTTKSWDVSIRHALRHIASVNARRNAGGWYLSIAELQTLLEHVHEAALDWASLEAHEGVYSTSELAALYGPGIIAGNRPGAYSAGPGIRLDVHVIRTPPVPSGCPRSATRQRGCRSRVEPGGPRVVLVQD